MKRPPAFPDPSKLADGQVATVEGGKWTAQTPGGSSFPIATVATGGIASPPDPDPSNEALILSDDGSLSDPISVPAGVTKVRLRPLSDAFKAAIGVVWHSPPFWKPQSGATATPNADGTFPVIASTTCHVGMITYSTWNYSDSLGAAVPAGAVVASWELEFLP
jgi:hypothetical protein